MGNMDVSFDDIVTDLQALYGGAELPETLDEFLADFQALYAGLELPMSMDEFLADFQALYGDTVMPISLNELLADFQALYAGVAAQDSFVIDTEPAPVVSHMLLSHVTLIDNQPTRSRHHRTETPISFTDIVADIHALYSGAGAVRLDDLIDDMEALYPVDRLPVRLCTMIADLQGLYGTGDTEVALDDLLTDLRALYGGIDAPKAARMNLFAPESAVRVDNFRSQFRTLHRVQGVLR
jgi:hypothetical protein